MSFPPAVAEAALVKCGRCCCICHKFCGTKIELHHIKQKAYGGEDTLENCIPLCFDCHSDMGKADPNHLKGKRYSEAELIMHRDNWFKKVENGFSFEIKHITAEDEKLFNEICTSFKGEVEYLLRDFDLRGTHIRRSFDSLFQLYYHSRDPMNEFINSELERLRADLINDLSQFLDNIGANTYPVGKEMPEYNATHLWLFDNGFIPRREVDEHKKEELYKQFVIEANEINDSANALWKSYSLFVRQGRRILANR